jgi:hypothetical protein
MNSDKESIIKKKSNPIWIVIWVAVFIPLLAANLQYLDAVLSLLYRYDYGWPTFGDSLWGSLPQLSALLAADLIATAFYSDKKKNPNLPMSD